MFRIRSNKVVMQLRKFEAAVPARHRENFLHLYFDIGWFGLLSGSTISFISVYLVRIGATASQIGLMNAAPAVIAIILSVPAGAWLKQQRIDRAVFKTSVYFRFFYLLWVPLPVIFGQDAQVWLVILITLLMSVPGTALAVGFNAMFADAVPPEWRGHVVGIRNAVLAVTTIIASLICGYLLDRLSFPLNYQLVFLLGFLGAAMSSYHLHRIRIAEVDHPRIGKTLGDHAQPGFMRPAGDGFQPGIGLRYLTRRLSVRLPSIGILRGQYGFVLLGLFLFHLTQHLAIPLFPIYWVDRLALTDATISIGTALFFATVFLGSTQLSRLTEKIGSHGVTVAGALLMAAYPGLTAITKDVPLYLFTSFVGGVAWSLAGGALSNYLLEKIPEGDRPAYLAWYMVIINLAVLSGSLLGPALARWIGLAPALLLAAAGRVLSAVGILRLGK